MTSPPEPRTAAGQETIMGMRPDSLVSELRSMVEAGRERNDPTLSLALSLDAVAFLLDRAEAAGAPLREALERIAYGDEFSTLNPSEDRNGMRKAAIVALAAPLAPDRCDEIVNNGMGEPTECGRTLPCEYHDEPAPAPLDVEALAKAMQSYYRRPPGWQTDPLPVDQRRAADTFAGHAEAIAAIYARLTARQSEATRAAATEDTDA